MRRRRRGWVAAACAVAVACLPVPVASASPDAGAAGSGSTAERACVASVTPESALLPTAESQVVDFQCFDSLSKALSRTGDTAQADTRGRPGTQRESVEKAPDNAVRLLGPVLGVNYASTGFGGEVLVLTAANGSGCVSGASYTFPDLSLYGFDNRISSAEMHSNCIARYHAGKNLNGDSKYCDQKRCADLGDLNRRASSVKFF